MTLARSSISRPMPSLSTVSSCRYQANPSTPTWVMLPPKQPLRSSSTVAAPARAAARAALRPPGPLPTTRTSVSWTTSTSRAGSWMRVGGRVAHGGVGCRATAKTGVGRTSTRTAVPGARRAPLPRTPGRRRACRPAARPGRGRAPRGSSPRALAAAPCLRGRTSPPRAARARSPGRVRPSLRAAARASQGPRRAPSGAMPGMRFVRPTNSATKAVRGRS